MAVEPLQAIIRGEDVTGVIVCTNETVKLFRDMGLYDVAFGADAVLVDVTYHKPRVGIGWRYVDGEFIAPIYPFITSSAYDVKAGTELTFTVQHSSITEGTPVTFSVNGQDLDPVPGDAQHQAKVTYTPTEAGTLTVFALGMGAWVTVTAAPEATA